MATGLERRTLLGWMVEPDQRAPIRSTQTNAESFITTSAGSTTTTICTGLTFATNDGYVGLLLTCVAVATPGTNGQNVGVTVEVVTFNAGTDTLGHDAFPAGTESGDQFVLWMPPDPVFVERAGGSATNIDGRDAGSTETNRDEADSYYVGDYMVARQTASITIGTARQISSFTSATGVAVCATFGANSAVGDLFYARRYPKTWGPVNFVEATEDIEHVSQRGNFSVDQSIKGATAWTCDVTLPLKGSGTAAGNGTAAIAPPELARPLGALFATNISTGEALTGGSVTVPEVTDGTLAQFPVGSWVLDSAGCSAVVTATNADAGNPDEISVSPPLVRAPIAAEILYGGYGYQIQTTGHLTMTFDVFEGGIVTKRGYGGIPTSLKLTDFKRNSIPKFVASYAGNFCLRSSYAWPAGLSPTFDTVRPFSAHDCQLSLAATNSSTLVRMIVDDAEIDYRIEAVLEESSTLPDGVYGYRIVGMRPRITVTAKLDTTTLNNFASWTEVMRYLGSQTFCLRLQHGRDAGSTVGWYTHRAAWLSPAPSARDNLRYVTFTAEVLASELASMPDCTLGFM